MTMTNLDPKARRKQIRDGARKAMKMIDETLRDRKVEITSVSIAGDVGMHQVDCGGFALVNMPIGRRTLTINIEMHAAPLRGNRS